MIVVASKLESGGRDEDRLVVERTGDRMLVVVADGAGGTAGGARAAEATCEALIAVFREATPGARTWDAHLRVVDSIIMTAGHGGSSTAVVVEIAGGVVSGASVGDSGAWIVSATGIVDLSEGQVRKPLLGTGLARPVAFGPVPLFGRLLVGTDGLFKYAARDRLASATFLGSVETAVTGLVDLVRLKNGRLQDDVAVVVCEGTRR